MEYVRDLGRQAYFWAWPMVNVFNWFWLPAARRGQIEDQSSTPRSFVIRVQGLGTDEMSDVASAISVD